MDNLKKSELLELKTKLIKDVKGWKPTNSDAPDCFTMLYDYDNAVKKLNIADVRSRSINEIEYQAEQNECANMYLDELGIPKEDANNEKYSTVGRIKYLEQNGF